MENSARGGKHRSRNEIVWSGRTRLQVISINLAVDEQDYLKLAHLDGGRLCRAVVVYYTRLVKVDSPLPRPLVLFQLFSRLTLGR
jgi:hypothetical protein